MQQTPASALKEHAHGTKSFPCAIYHTGATQKGTLVKHHWHEEVEILYFYGGSFRLEINMEQFLIDSECIYFINPGELHSIITEKQHNCSGEYAILFHLDTLHFEDYDPVQMQIINPIRKGQLLFPRCITPDHPSFLAIRSAFNGIVQSFGWQISETFPNIKGATTDDLSSQIYIKGSLLHILATLSGQQLFTATEKNYDKRIEDIKKVLTYIKEHYQEKIYIRDLANLVSMNEQYFSRLFKKVLRRTPMEYINDYRIKQTLRLLEETDLQVMDICLECGFNNLGNFLREFKKHTGTTPLQYRKEFLISSKKS